MGVGYELATWAAQNIHIPFSISMVLYIWITIGYAVMGQQYMAVAWFCYSVANGAFMGDALSRLKNTPA